MVRGVWLGILLAGLGGWWGMAWAQNTGTPGMGAFSSNPLIRQGKVLYNDQKFKQAVVLFQRALKWPKSKKADKIEAYKYLAFISIILKQHGQARHYFFRLLQLNPSFTLDSAWDPPKFVKFFAATRREFRERNEVKIFDMNPREVPHKSVLILRFKVRDLTKRMKRVVLWYRNEGDSSYSRRVLGGKKAAKRHSRGVKWFTIAVPPPQRRQERAYYFEYYLVAFDQNNRPLTRKGSNQNPLKIKRTFEEEPDSRPVVVAPPFYKQWWFWTIVGGVAVAGGAAAVTAVLLQPKPPELGGAEITIVRIQ